jgi:nicotinamide mononucleotide transporter
MQLLFLGIITGLLWLWLSTKTDSTTPIPDAFTTALSLIATYGQAKKLIESWYFWILADLIYVPLYLYKHLPLTAILYTGFLALCVMGLRAWVKDGAKFSTTYECEF